ncbi:MAG: hypothetical protein DRG30_08435 [Epsilonproteobacteria bacterium]|nr:MAG: hypothetical protein DRG30_08435 [Campylobacterota bacterium]
MSNFKLEFTLKQHTPMIHFQSDQSGATLRATELKPKLDRFLLENVEGIPFRENANGHRSLEYRVKIETDMSKSTPIDKRDPLFFGNMGDEQDKEFKNNPKNFKINFFSFNGEVHRAIEKHFEAFLANTNFGTRQSKGFGSYYIDNKKFDISLVKYKTYSFASRNWKKDIGLLYQFLRQGINLSKRPRSPFYTKPAIFSYAKSKGWQWDKKSIKETYFNNALKNQQREHKSDILNYSSEEKYLLRDLFGLSLSQEWMTYHRTVEKEHQEIERFKSPITFKVVDNIVYFWVNNTVEDMLSKQFRIRAGGGNDSLRLSTPSEFNFDEFFDFAFNINLSTHIDNRYHATNEYKTLSRILGEVR